MPFRVICCRNARRILWTLNMARIRLHGHGVYRVWGAVWRFRIALYEVLAFRLGAAAPYHGKIESMGIMRRLHRFEHRPPDLN
jgi:hypothetical protein